MMRDRIAKVRDTAKRVPTVSVTLFECRVCVAMSFQTADARLVIVGEGPESERIAAEARTRGVAARMLMPPNESGHSQ